MKNLCKRKRVMDRWPVHWGICLLLLLGFITGLTADAGAEYVRPDTEPPTPADLVMIGGKSKTVVIQLLNLTPYTISEDPSGITAQGSLDKNRSVAKSLMFAPVGWPTTMPGIQGSWVEDPLTGQYAFVPSDTNTTLHPYSFVVSWDDRGGFVYDSSMGWTINDVYTSAHGPQTQNVPLRLWFSRVNAPDMLRSQIFRLLSATLTEAFSIIGVIVFPAVPPVWLSCFAGTYELANSAFEIQNSIDNGLNKMYLAAYTIPDDPDWTGSPSVKTNSLSGESTDAVDVQWGTNSGYYSANVVITTHLLRGWEPVLSSEAQGFVDDFGGWRLPIVGVTVWDPGYYIWAKTNAVLTSTAHPVGQRIHAVLGTHDRSRYAQFVFLYKSLNPSQRRTFDKTLEQLFSGDPLTHQQEVLLEKMAAALEKGQTKLSPANRNR